MDSIKNPNSAPFEEYQRGPDPSKRERSYAWHTAIGLQAVDGLETSEYLKKPLSRISKARLQFQKRRH